MRLLFILLILIPTSFISSCKKDKTIELKGNDFLIFGHFYGFCEGEKCVETFKLTSKKLFEDSNDNYSGTDFLFSEIEESKFEGVKNLLDYFPIELLNENENTIGCPDCADQGGILIQYVENGTIQNWRIDQSKSAIPEYLHEFLDQVNEKIDFINN